MTDEIRLLDLADEYSNAWFDYQDVALREDATAASDRLENAREALLQEARA